MATSSEEHDTSAGAAAAATPSLSSPLPKRNNYKTYYRGIRNKNGTGCHTSSALQLLFHCFPRLREELLQLASVSANCTVHLLSFDSSKDRKHNHAHAVEKEFVYQLSWFFYLLANAEDILALAQSAKLSPAGGKQKKSSTKKSKRSIRSKKKIYEKKAAAIDAFMAKSREGKTNMLDWRNLVDAMKEYNRNNYDRTLEHVLNRRRNNCSGTGGGVLGGGRKSTTFELSCSTLKGAGDAIDPTKFYEHLMTYTKETMEARHHVNTNNVGDAAVVFRCLIAALEFSINRELTRLDEMIGLFEIESWNGETKEGDETLQFGRTNAYKLRSSVFEVRAAMEYEWKGNLLSRIVGTSQTGTVSSDNIITTTTITRTKKNGNIERPIPIPWQLPVLEQTSNVNAVDESTRCYYQSLVTSLHSVTISPNPIRGYNWHGLVKSGDVNEEITITRMDENGNILVEKEEDVKDSNQGIDARSTAAVEGSLLILESINEEVHKNGETSSPAKPFQSDDASVVSTTSRVSMLSVSSRTIGTQTDRDDVEVRTITVRTTTETETHDVETSSATETSSQLNAIKFAIKKDSCYAAAVAALSTAPGKSKTSTKKPTPAPAKNERDTYYAAAVAALSSVPSRNLRLDDIEVSFLNSYNSDDDSSYEDDSNSESSVDSKVPLDDADDASSETHSSAIDTPSDIDNISLGSWTDSEAGDEEKKNEDDPLIRNVFPVLRALECNDSDLNPAQPLPPSSGEEKSETSNVVPTEVTHSVCSNSYSAVSDSNSHAASSSGSEDDSSASSSSSSTSSTGSDSTSSTDSSSTSSSSSSGSSSSDRDTAIIGVVRNGEERHVPNSAKTKEWTTRKETRFCQPLPRSLVFHLKRFAFNRSGHGEKLPGSLNIPEELNLRTCCLEQQTQVVEESNEQYCYQLSGALVHVDPVLTEDEQDQLEYGTMSEGHYVTFICTHPADNKHGNNTWVELDDEFIRVVDSGEESSTHTALNVLSGCDVTNNEEACGTSTSSKRVVKEKERRYATLVVYSRKS